MKYRASVLLGGAVLSTLSGCAIDPQTGHPVVAPAVSSEFKSVFNSDDPCSNNDRNIGIAAGMVAGSVIGYLTHGAKGAVAGAAIGAGGGFLIGHLMDNRRCSLYKIAQQNGLKLASATITPAKLADGSPTDAMSRNNDTIGLDVQLQNNADEFVPGTAELTPQARRYFGQIAAEYAPKTALASLPASASVQQRQAALSHKIFIVGHTDERDAGTRGDLAALSEARAKSVARIFVEAGVAADNLYYQGAGDTLPIANNTTDQGRQENQRVEIVDVPTQADLERFLAQRSADPANYRAVNAGELSEPTDGTVVASNDAAPSVEQSADVHKSRRHRHIAHAKTSVAASGAETIEPVSTVASAQAAAPAPGGDSAAVPTTVAAEAPHRRVSGYDFGGTPTQGDGIPVKLGASVHKSMFSFISEAKADSIVTLGSCRGDQPHSASSVHNLATGERLEVRESVPGFYGAPWVGTLNKHLIAVMHAQVPVDAGSPVPEPELLIYKDYSGDKKQRPSYSAHDPVNVYRGSSATLYRIFVDGPMQCLDMIVPNSSKQAAAHVYYTNDSVNYTATGSFALR